MALAVAWSLPSSFDLDRDQASDYGHRIDQYLEQNMPTIQASEFKARCLALMDEVARNGGVWVVTKNGRPVAELHPYTGGRSGTPFGLHCRLEIRGDIIEPLDDSDWKALG